MGISFIQFEWIVAKSWNVFIVPFEVSLLNSLGKSVTSYCHSNSKFIVCYLYSIIRTVNSKIFKDER